MQIIHIKIIKMCYFLVKIIYFLLIMCYNFYTNQKEIQLVKKWLEVMT